MVGQGRRAETVNDVMTVNPITVTPAVLASQALSIMNGKRITQLIVLDGPKPVGVLHMHDLLRAGLM